MTATNMVVDMTQLEGDATFNNIQIGQDASTLMEWPKNDKSEVAQRQPGIIEITTLRQNAWAPTAGQFNLNGLSLKLVSGKHECF